MGRGRVIGRFVMRGSHLRFAPLHDRQRKQRAERIRRAAAGPGPDAIRRGMVNRSLDGEAIVENRYRHIGFAAGTPNRLVDSVIRNVDRKRIDEIAGECAELAGMARDGRLKPEQMQGGTFTVSGLGGIGGTGFKPITNAPEVAILGVTRSRMQPVWDGAAFQPRQILPLCLSWDHRAVDGAAAARCLAHLARLLGELGRLLIQTSWPSASSLRP